MMVGLFKNFRKFFIQKLCINLNTNIIISQNKNYFRNQIKYLGVITFSISNFLGTLEDTKIVHSFLMAKNNALTCSERNIRIDIKHFLRIPNIIHQK